VLSPSQCRRKRARDVALTLDIVTPKGRTLHAENLDRVVVRRREEAFDPGSEFAICPHHAPLLMQTQACEMRLVSRGRTERIDVEPGVLEVLGDTVTLLVT
jgi:F0F1-type ATP synthase epsilon subunit